MSYLTAHRYGLTKVPARLIPFRLREGGWRLVWEHPSGLYAAKNPATGRWHVTDGATITGEGWSSSLRAAAARITRLTNAGVSDAR